MKIVCLLKYGEEFQEYELPKGSIIPAVGSVILSFPLKYSTNNVYKSSVIVETIGYDYDNQIVFISVILR